MLNGVAPVLIFRVLKVTETSISSLPISSNDSGSMGSGDGILPNGMVKGYSFGNFGFMQNANITGVPVGVPIPIYLDSDWSIVYDGDSLSTANANEQIGTGVFSSNISSEVSIHLRVKDNTLFNYFLNALNLAYIYASKGLARVSYFASHLVVLDGVLSSFDYSRNAESDLMELNLKITRLDLLDNNSNKTNKGNPDPKVKATL